MDILDLLRLRIRETERDAEELLSVLQDPVPWFATREF